MGGVEWVRAGIHANLSRVRRSIASASPQAFARIYLAHHFSKPPSSMHAELFALLAEATATRGARLAVAAPRGHAKSTIVSLAYVLWSVLEGHDRFAWLVSATKDQAGQLLTHAKDELETNPLIRADYPEACPNTGRGRPKPVPWRGTRLALPNGAAIFAAGFEQELRGRRHGQHRPSLIIVDDGETPEGVLSEDQRIKTRSQFEKTLMKAGENDTNIIVIGTRLHQDSLLARLLRQAGWTGRVYKALITPPENIELWKQWESIYDSRERSEKERTAAAAFFEAHRAEMERGAQVLWPEKDPLYALMEMRLREGKQSFESEKQNEPLDPEECIFSAAEITYWDDHETERDLIVRVGRYGEFVGGLDPSLGKRSQGGDYAALISLLVDTSTGTMYVVDATVERKKPDEQIELIKSLHQVRKFREFAIEVNQFQDLLADQLKKELEKSSMHLRLKEVSHTTSKVARIQGLQPLIARGKLQFRRSHARLIEQLKQFPFGSHDDGPDALELAVDASRRPPKPQVIIGW